MNYRNTVNLSIRLLAFILLGSLLISCGNENDEKNDSIVKEEVEDAPIGLLGNVYRNQNYVFKISNLPPSHLFTYATQPIFFRKMNQMGFS